MVMSKARAKGTSGERELALRWGLRRTPMGTRWDLERDGSSPSLRILAIRPDKGKWLYVLDDEAMAVLLSQGNAVQMEAKRRKTSALHSMWKEEMEWT